MLDCGNSTPIKGDGGVVGLTDNSSARIHRMVAGPKVARVMEEFRDKQQITMAGGVHVDTSHHDQTLCCQAAFAMGVCPLVSVIDNFAWRKFQGCKVHVHNRSVMTSTKLCRL